MNSRKEQKGIRKKLGWLVIALGVIGLVAPFAYLLYIYLKVIYNW